jgi:hypothetical protein
MIGPVLQQFTAGCEMLGMIVRSLHVASGDVRKLQFDVFARVALLMEKRINDLSR